MKLKSTFKTMQKAGAAIMLTTALFCGKDALAQLHVKSASETAIGTYYFDANEKDVDIKSELYISHVPNPMMPGIFYSGTFFEHKVCASGHSGWTHTAPIFRPQWNSHAFIGEAGNEFAEVHTTFAFSSLGMFQTSDRKLKTNIMPIESSLNKLLGIKSYTYDFVHQENLEMPNEWNEYQKFIKKNHSGFMAQDVETVFPHLVNHNQKADKYYLNYIGFIPEIVRAMQEQQEMIDDLRTQIEQLKTAEGNDNTTQEKTTPVVETTKQTALLDIKPIAAKETIALPYKIAEAQDNHIRVYDLSGKQVYKTETLNAATQEVIIPRKKLSPGTYYYTLLSNGDEIATKKLIVLD